MWLTNDQFLMQFWSSLSSLSFNRFPYSCKPREEIWFPIISLTPAHEIPMVRSVIVVFIKTTNSHSFSFVLINFVGVFDWLFIYFFRNSRVITLCARISLLLIPNTGWFISSHSIDRLLRVFSNTRYPMNTTLIIANTTHARLAVLFVHWNCMLWHHVYFEDLKTHLY